MRKYKNNIILSVRNITLNCKIITLSLQNIISYLEILILKLKILTGHLTERVKILILSFKNITLSYKILTFSLLILMLSLVNITLCFSNCYNNVSALSYESNIGVDFTFNPTLSISLSSSDLIISNLTPGTTEDSNDITISVATNAAYGYTLSTSVNNENLVHSNNINTFSSIATNANLVSLTSDNTWGYTSKLNSETTWNNYNGLSSSSSTVLLDNNNVADGNGSVDFKISAKASGAQPSGIYAGIINFYAVTKPTPTTLAEAYASEGKSMINGFHTMQDMTHTICEKTEAIGSQLQVLDIRDNKLYKITKLKDDKCWMVENLDLAGGTMLSSDTTDFDPTYTIPDTQGWQADGILPESSANGFSDDNYAYVYNSNNKTCTANRPCYSYYSWDAATLGSGRDISMDNIDAPYSVCPKGWRLPATRTSSTGSDWQLASDFYVLARQYGLNDDTSTSEYSDGFYIHAGPGTIPNFSLAGRFNSSFGNGGSRGYYWSATSFHNNTNSRDLLFDQTLVFSANYGYRRRGLSVRCLAR